ncbi:MAG TPA: bifunctional 3-(3-hydroxy-phenyl)propionate/3-hydroxycinnamic acid hydroxylase [Acidimicrobiales bacterium]|nr:bifunctional 3-(3-hydroxy-phenyl)propionate/3-hydroxycinnamic acid hydroxylase [Acidimicrobiales bacterium]
MSQGTGVGTTDFDVAIVGCGPVGAVLAALLGQRGRRVVVVERHAAPYDLPRAVHFDHEVGRILQGLGIGAELRAISEPGSEYEWRNGSGQTLLRFGGRPVGPCGWPDSSMFWQPALERLVESAAAEQPTVEIRRGTSVRSLDDHGDGVTLQLEPTGGGAAETVDARFVVGCDGANSTVRDLVGIPVTDLGFFYDWLIVDLELHEERTFDPINVQICEPSRPTTMVSGGPGRRRWEFMRLPHETAAELDDVDRAWALLEPWDVRPGNATLERHAVYRFQARWAEGWRAGNVLIAGAAAHLMPPFAGQGMCAGIRDAANLAWKLDLVLADAAPADLLDAYEVERADNVKAVIDLSMALGQVICITDPDEAAARDEAMALGAAAGAQPQPGLPGLAGGIARLDDPAGGTLLPQGRVDLGTGAMLLDDAVGTGWRLVTTDADLAAQLPGHERDWFASLGGAVVTIDERSDVDGTYAAWAQHHGVTTGLQRPDFHLFGTAAGADGAAGLLSALRSALAAPADHLAPTPDPGGTP